MNIWMSLLRRKPTKCPGSDAQATAVQEWKYRWEWSVCFLISYPGPRLDVSKWKGPWGNLTFPSLTFSRRLFTVFTSLLLWVIFSTLSASAAARSGASSWLSECPIFQGPTSGSRLLISLLSQGLLGEDTAHVPLIFTPAFFLSHLCNLMRSVLVLNILWSIFVQESDHWLNPNFDPISLNFKNLFQIIGIF